MRDLDKRDLITGDFLLVAGDVVSNLPLEPALAKHRARREKNKNAIMTMVLREAGVEHRTKNKGRRPVFIIDPAAERCLHYEEMNHNQKDGRYINLDPELLTTHDEIEVREDLIDCYVDICTQDVLGLWSDNFDYQSVRKSFLFGVLKDYELNGKTIHTHIIRQQYAARVRSLRAYDSVSKDIVSRWTYPLCPDSNLVLGQSYRLERGKVYEEDGVVLARGSVVKRRSVLGKDTSIGDGSIVGDSILGRRCHIGRNVVVDGAYIWDDAVIGDGSIVRQSIVANEAVIGRNCVIEPGALISYGVRIADGTTVLGRNKLTRAKRKPQDMSTQTDFEIVGKGGEGYSYASDTDSESESSTISSHLIYLQPPASLSNSSISTLHSDESDSHIPRDTSRRDSFRSDPSDDTAQTRDFHLDATTSIFEGLQKGDSLEVIHLELLGQRLTANATDHMMRSALVSAFMKRISSLIEVPLEGKTSGLGVSEAVSQVLDKYNDLITQMAIFDKGHKQKADQIDFLLLVQKDVMGRGKGETLMLFVAKALYELDVVEEDGVLQWWEDERGREGEMGKTRGLTTAFITWLKEAQEEEDDDEDDESGESADDE